MNKKILLSIVATSLLASSIAGGILGSEHASATPTTYKQVNLNFWNDLANDSHLHYQAYSNSTTDNNVAVKVGRHAIHDYGQALITSDVNASQKVMLNTQTSVSGYPKFAQFNFILKDSYKNNDAVLNNVDGSSSYPDTGYLHLANGQTSITNVTGFAIRDRANYSTAQHAGYMYFTIFYGNSQSNTTTYYLR